VHKAVLSSHDVVAFTTQRGDVRVPVRAGWTADSIDDHLIYYLPPVIDSIVSGDRADLAGFKRGDSIVAVAGQPAGSWIDMVDQIASSPNRAVTMVVRRGAVTDTLIVTPKAVHDVDPATGLQRTIGKIGAGPRDPSRKESLSLVAAIGAGGQITWRNAGMVFTVLHQIGSGEASVRQLGGPIAIARASVAAARNGLEDFFSLIALLSINVAVLNLLPIPILDGGQILINVLESAKGSPFSMRTKEYILRFGLVAIALLFAIVMYNDTRAGFVKLFGWVGSLFGA
jgi:regulator of sigma E protease